MVFVGLKKRAPKLSLPSKDNLVNSSCNSEDKKLLVEKAGTHREQMIYLLSGNVLLYWPKNILLLFLDVSSLLRLVVNWVARDLAIHFINFWPANILPTKQTAQILLFRCTHTPSEFQQAIPNRLLLMAVSFTTPLTPAGFLQAKIQPFTFSGSLFLSPTTSQPLVFLPFLKEQPTFVPLLRWSYLRSITSSKVRTKKYSSLHLLSSRSCKQ